MSFVRGHRRTRTQAEVNVLEACKVNSSLPSQTFACTTAKPLDLSDKLTLPSPATGLSSACLAAVPLAQAESKPQLPPYTLSKKLSAKDSSHASGLKEFRFPKIDNSSIPVIAPVITALPATSTPPAAAPGSALETIVESSAGRQIVQGEEEEEGHSCSVNATTVIDAEAVVEALTSPSPPYLDCFFRERVTKSMMEVIKNGRTRRLVRSTTIVEPPSPAASALIRREYKCREKSSALYLNSGISKTYRLKLWEPIVSPTLVS